jgi:hypothetical protein
MWALKGCYRVSLMLSVIMSYKLLYRTKSYALQLLRLRSAERKGEKSRVSTIFCKNPAKSLHY